MACLLYPFVILHMQFAYLLKVVKHIMTSQAARLMELYLADPSIKQYSNL